MNLTVTLTSKYEVGDEVYVEAYGMNTYRRVKILAIEIAQDKSWFVYKISARLSNNDLIDKLITEDKLYGCLAALQAKWSVEICHPIEY